jgi:hypothetical protein
VTIRLVCGGKLKLGALFCDFHQQGCRQHASPLSVRHQLRLLSSTNEDKLEVHDMRVEIECEDWRTRRWKAVQSEEKRSSSMTSSWQITPVLVAKAAANLSRPHKKWADHDAARRRNSPDRLTQFNTLMSISQLPGIIQITSPQKAPKIPQQVLITPSTLVYL